jgi:lipopolysaccharide/colanic/teichoic acid biosynthesis glycosyltransferase
MVKRLFDIIFSFTFLILLSPLFIYLSFIIWLHDKGSVFFLQERVGKDQKTFKLVKFRTMYLNSEKKGQLTIGSRDSRITKPGLFLRKYKIDELPQLWNVLVGDMSLVGPRPEVPRYVKMYNSEQLKVLTIKPGITDHASLLYFEESELLAKSPNPEQTYIAEVMPAKLKLNLEYIDNHSFTRDLIIIWQTVRRMFS